MLCEVKGGSQLSNTLTAIPANVLSGKIFYGDGSKKPQTGTMTNKGGAATAATASFDATNTRVVMTIPTTGYYNTSSTLYSTASNFGDAAAGNVLSGKYFTSTAGLKVQGTMTNKSGSSTAATVDISSSNIRMKIPANGYYDTSAYLTSATSNFGNATAAQVLKDKTFTSTAGLKVAGTMTNYTVSSETVRKTFTPSTSAQSYTIPAGYYSGSNVVKCNAISTQTKTVKPTTSSQTVSPDSGKYLSSVTVNAIPNLAVKQYTTFNNVVEKDITITTAVTNGLLVVSACKDSTGNLYVYAKKTSGTVTLTKLREQTTIYPDSAKIGTTTYRITATANSVINVYAADTSGATSGNQGGGFTVQILRY